MTEQHWVRRVNAAIVAYLVKCGGATWEELRDIFAEPDDIAGARERFRRRMEYLLYVGAVTADLGRGPTRRYEAVEPVAAPGDTQPEPYVGEIVPSPAHDVMHALAYVPEPEPALRAGALDYKAVPSRGWRC